MPAIAIDPCVEVDADEVRRLAALELNAWRAGPSDALSVLVTCDGEVQELRLVDRVKGQETVRNLDLSAASGTDRDAKTRELALAIAELLRRAQVAVTPEPALAPSLPPAPIARERQEGSPATPAERGIAARPFRLELGAAGRATTWTGGEMLFGADVTARTHLSRWLILDLRVGGTKSRPVALAHGTLDAFGVSAAAGIALDVTPSWQSVGVALGARFGADWLRYAAMDHGGVAYGGHDAGAVTASGTLNAFAALSGQFCITADAAIGGALHSVAIHDNGQNVSGLSGAFFSGAFGVAAHF